VTGDAPRVVSPELVCPELVCPDLVWQGSLFAEPAAGGELSFEGPRHEPLDDRSWVDLVPGWVGDHEALFERLRQEAPWRRRSRTRWDKDVLEPRLVAAWAVGESVPAYLQGLREVLSERYGVGFDSCLVNLYRDGDDAVAWHGDTVRKVLRDPLVATVSLGQRRRFLMRPVGGGPVARAYAPGEGDLLVMGGACQHEWVHTVPREKRASGARMSVTLRNSRPAA